MKKYFFLYLMLPILNGFAQTQEDGIKQIDYEQYGKAKKIFQTLIQKDPVNARNFYYLGETYFYTNNIDSADYFYKKGIEVNPKDAYNFIGTGKVLLQKDNEEAATEQFRKGISATGKDVVFYTTLAEAWTICKKTNFDNAKKYLEKAKDIKESNPDIYLKYGDMILAKDKNGGEAINEYNKAIYYDKNSAKAYFKEGMVYLRGKIVKEAIDAFLTSISMDSNYVPAYRELGEIYLLAKKYDKAVETYNKYISKSDYILNDHVRYAAMLFYNKDYTQAINILNELYQREPKNTNTLRMLAYTSYETADFTKGMDYINIFFKLIDKAKIQSTDYEYYANLLSKSGKDSLAIVNYENTINMDSSKINLFENIAKIYEKNKKYRNAADSYDKYINSFKEPVGSTYFMFGKSCYNMIANDTIANDTATINIYVTKADSAFSKFSQVSVTPHLGFLFRARIYAIIDKPSDPKNPYSIKGLAKPNYEKVISLLENSNTPKFNRDLIEAYNYLKFAFYAQYEKEAKKNKTSALQNLDNSISNAEKVVALDPNDSKASDALKNLKKLRMK